MVEWLMAQNNHIVHSRHHAMGMWQALLEEGVLIHVNRDRSRILFLIAALIFSAGYYSAPIFFTIQRI